MPKSQKVSDVIVLDELVGCKNNRVAAVYNIFLTNELILSGKHVHVF